MMVSYNIDVYNIFKKLVYRNDHVSFLFYLLLFKMLAALAQMVACLPWVQQVRGSIPGGVGNFHLKIFNLGARTGGYVLYLIARLYMTGLD